MDRQLAQSNVLAFVCLVIFLDALGVGLILPVMPELIGELAHVPNSRAAEISGYLMFAFAGMQFFCAPVLGALSDRYGRRPILLLSLAGFSVDYFVMSVAPTLAWLFVARMLSGLFAATFAASNASLVDVSTPGDRARLFGFTGAAVGAGFIFGPAAGGLLGVVDTRLPFLVAGLLTAAVCAYGTFAFPETLARDKRRAFELSRANPLGSLKSIARYPAVLTLLMALFCIQVSNQSYASIWAFYAIEVANWSPLGIGVSAALYGFMMVLVQGFLTGPVIKRTGEWRALWFGLLMGLISYTGLAFAGGPVAIYASIIVGGLSGFIFPAMQSLMTRSVPANAQGELQGAISSSFSLAIIVGPIVMSQIFSTFTSGEGPHFPGAAFVAAAGLVVCAALVLHLWGPPAVTTGERAGG